MSLSALDLQFVIEGRVSRSFLIPEWQMLTRNCNYTLHKYKFIYTKLNTSSKMFSNLQTNYHKREGIKMGYFNQLHLKYIASITVAKTNMTLSLRQLKGLKLN